MISAESFTHEKKNVPSGHTSGTTPLVKPSRPEPNLSFLPM